MVIRPHERICATPSGSPVDNTPRLSPGVDDTPPVPTTSWVASRHEPRHTVFPEGWPRRANASPSRWGWRLSRAGVSSYADIATLTSRRSGTAERVRASGGEPSRFQHGQGQQQGRTRSERDQRPVRDGEAREGVAEHDGARERQEVERQVRQVVPRQRGDFGFRPGRPVLKPEGLWSASPNYSD